MKNGFNFEVMIFFRSCLEGFVQNQGFLWPLHSCRFLRNILVLNFLAAVLRRHYLLAESVKIETLLFSHVLSVKVQKYSNIINLYIKHKNESIYFWNYKKFQGQPRLTVFRKSDFDSYWKTKKYVKMIPDQNSNKLSHKVSWG